MKINPSAMANSPFLFMDLDQLETLANVRNPYPEVTSKRVLASLRSNLRELSDLEIVLRNRFCEREDLLYAVIRWRWWIARVAGEISSLIENLGG